MKRFLLLTALLIIKLSSSMAQWTSDTTQNTLVRDSSGATIPLVSSGPDGKTYISWFEQDTSDYVLHMQLLDSNGYKLWAAEGIVVSNYPQNSALYRYDLKTDNEGNAIVAFQDERSGSLHIVAYKIDINGNSTWGPAGVTLIDSLSTQGLAPAIGITSQNDIVIAWNPNSGSLKWIAAQRLSPSGVIQWNNIYRIKDTLSILKYSRPVLLPHGNNGVQMFFVEENGNIPGVTSTMYLHHIDSAGNNLLPAAIKISTKTIPYYIFPQPIPDNAGGFYVAFNTSNPVSSFLNDVYVQHVDSAGNLWDTTGTEAANSTSGGKTIASSCFVPAMNEFWVLMSIVSSGDFGISVQKFDSAGNVLLGPDGLYVQPLNTVTLYPATINDASNGVILTTIYGAFGNERISAAKLDYTGLTLWTNTFVSICAVLGDKDDLQSRAFFNDNLVLVWQDDRSGGGIFAQNITGSGGMGIVSGISDVKSEDNFSFYPNPSIEPAIYFNETSNSEKLIIVFDLSGRKIYSEIIPGTESRFELSVVKNLSEGMYLICIENNTGKKIIRWVKN